METLSEAGRIGNSSKKNERLSGLPRSPLIVGIVPHPRHDGFRVGPSRLGMGVADRTRFQVQDLFQTDLSPATVVTMYLLPDVNLQLRPALLALKPGTRIVSHDWDMGDWKPDRSTVVPVPDKKVGREKSSKVHFWIVPARVHGLWCSTGPLHEFCLRLTQRHQEVQGEELRLIDAEGALMPPKGSSMWRAAGTSCGQ